MHVLIADDDVPFLDSLAELLRASGYDVATASNGAEALERVAACDVLVTDVCLPNLNGLALQQQASAANRALRVIVMTGFDSPTVCDEAMTAGACAYLPKPFRPAKLIDLLRSMDGERKAVAARRHEDPIAIASFATSEVPRRQPATTETTLLCEKPRPRPSQLGDARSRIRRSE